MAKALDKLCLILAALIAVVSCFQKPGHQNVENAMKPQVGSDDPTAIIFNGDEEIQVWISKAQHCLTIGKWSCTDEYAQKLVSVEDPVVRAFGHWIMGLSKLQNNDPTWAFTYFGLAVQENPMRSTFHKWFSLAAFMINQHDIARRHRDWLIIQKDNQDDTDLYVLSQLLDMTVTTPDAKTPTEDPLRLLRAPASSANYSLTALWTKGIYESVKKHCGPTSSYGYCH